MKFHDFMLETMEKKMSCLANIFWVQNDLREIAGILDLSHRDVSTTQPLSPP